MESKKNITNDIVTEYINQFYRPKTEEIAKLREEAEAEHVPIILRETEQFLATMLTIIKPKKILEIGCAVGYSSMFFAAQSDAEIVTVEKDPDVFETASRNILRMGYQPRITVLCGDGEEKIEELAAEGNDGFDFVFIDAAKSHYKRFFNAARKVCTENAVIVSDNVLFQGRVASDIYDPAGKYKTNIRKMREFLDYITDLPDAETSIAAVGDGLAITVLPGK